MKQVMSMVIFYKSVGCLEGYDGCSNTNIHRVVQRVVIEDCGFNCTYRCRNSAMCLNFCSKRGFSSFS